MLSATGMMSGFYLPPSFSLSFCLSVCLSVRPSVSTCALHYDRHSISQLDRQESLQLAYI